MVLLDGGSSIDPPPPIVRCQRAGRTTHPFAFAPSDSGSVDAPKSKGALGESLKFPVVRVRRRPISQCPSAAAAWQSSSINRLGGRANSGLSGAAVTARPPAPTIRPIDPTRPLPAGTVRKARSGTGCRYRGAPRRCRRANVERSQHESFPRRAGRSCAHRTQRPTIRFEPCLIAAVDLAFGVRGVQ